jgi:glycosyltransferase involved in cell wall biosynthesis
MNKILLLTLSWPSNSNSNLYKDLMREFKNQGHEVYVLTTLEKRFGNENSVENDEGIYVHRIACGNITKTGFVEKTISLLKLNRLLIEANKKVFADVMFDLIIVSTPSITFAPVVKILKRKNDAFIYLLLKDMWPQGAVDLGVIKKFGLVWCFFRRYEKSMYKISDKIGCMSKGAVDFLLLNNSKLSSNKVEVCPNSLAKYKSIDSNSSDIYTTYNIPTDKILFIYGGNISLSHGIDFLLDCIRTVKGNKKIHFIIVGSGTHFENVKKIILRDSLFNVTLLDRLPSNDYQKLLSISDFGIALLNPRYKVPQFPSKIIDYLKLSKPVLAITNKNADVGRIISNNGAGFCIDSYDINDFLSIIDKICSDSYNIKIASHNARALFEREYTTKTSYDVIYHSYLRSLDDR